MPELREADPGRPLLHPRQIALYRHALMTRLTHWINLLCVVVLLMSGLQIFNAHPALYWGQAIANQCIALAEQPKQIQPRINFHWWPKPISPT